jgi:hypothetical protein
MYIARTAHVRPVTVAIARRVLKVPNLNGPRKIEDLAVGFYERTRQVEGGHREWRGVAPKGVPSIFVEGRQVRARVAAFRVRMGRDPVGLVRPGCGVGWCVEPDHMEDRPMREAYEAIFGGLP